MSSLPLFTGVDVGSISVKLAALSAGDIPDVRLPGFFSIRQGPYTIFLSTYRRTKGEILQTALNMFSEFTEQLPFGMVEALCTTGSGGKLLADRLGVPFENEFRAVAKAVGTLFPDVRTVFEMGGDTAKYLLLNPDSLGGTVGIVDYEKNGDCAAGTGSFMDQQASRLKYNIDDIGEIVLKAGKAATIAGRCSVFAKSDMIHAQQRGFHPPEILKGLCEAVVRNYKSTIVRGRTVVPKVIFVGGVAANKGVAQAMKDVFNLSDDEFIIPECYAWVSAIGAALLARESQQESKPRAVQAASRSGRLPEEERSNTLSPLDTKRVIFLRDRVRPYSFQENQLPVDVYLGIDIGSVSTNVVLLDASNNIVKEIYVYTEARPIDVVNRCLKELEDQLGDRILVKGVGTTGSGRELIGELIGADVIKDEITAHKTGATAISKTLIDRRVDTIFEIGGQDSKFISLDDDVVVDFSMNEACAAGTGSFLEEQAERLGISIKGEFSKLAFESRNPIKFGERCTVFMEKDVNAYLQQGASKVDLVAGLAYSIVFNYLNRVVRGRRIGDGIYFQGGTAYNDAVAAAFSLVLGKPIIVPPHNGVIGAIGAAILAREKVTALNVPTTFRGFQLDNIQYTVRHFTCKACSNYCDMQEIKVNAEKTFWGDKCSDKFRKKTKAENKPVIPDLIKAREEILNAACEPYHANGARTVGIPLAMQFYEQLPFWTSYFSCLGFKVVVSETTNREMVNAGIDATIAEPCFPIKVAHGHVKSLINKKTDYIFLPNLIDAETRFDGVNSYYCPWNQTLPFVIGHSPLRSAMEGRLLMPTIHFREGEGHVARELYPMAKGLGLPRRTHEHALRRAYETQREFQRKLYERGKQALDLLEAEKELGLILVGRVYNLYDRGMNLNIPNKLREYYGVNVIPIDFLELDDINISETNSNMFWDCGRKILQACSFIRNRHHLQFLYITNFKCGPDSYIKHYVGNASHKPFLTLQFDGHANDAGMMTRCEAYLESKGFLRWRKAC
jgi:predicted CoA-substrate-specific enzyme activase